MDKIQLAVSPVNFNEEHHIYSLEGKRLMGITELIHKALGLGVYPDASDYVKEYSIPKAGSLGTAVHHAIQTFDAIGERETEQSVLTRYGSAEKGTLETKLETWDVAFQLDAYIFNKTGFRALENEYTVSDLEKWASQIDNVWLKEATGGIWLVDTKTNNLDYYPKCGYFLDNYFITSQDALKEYLSWQLSIYAVLFERQNPTLKVEGLACNWLRPDCGEFWEIERKPDHQVLKLLEASYSTDSHPVEYHCPSLVDIFGSVPVAKTNSLPMLPEDFILLIYNVAKQYEVAEKQLKEMKTFMRKAMEKEGIKSFDTGKFKATIAADSETSSFDSAAFKNDYPDLYEKYMVKKERKGGFTIKLRD